MALVGIVRQKALAIAVGPVGIGVIGYLTTFLAFATTVGVVGLNTSAVRYVALVHSAGGEDRRGTVSALLVLSLALSVIVGGLLWTGLSALKIWGDAEEPLARYAVLVAFAVVLSIHASLRVALINGAKRVRDYVRVNFLGAVIATLLVLGGLGWIGPAAFALAVIGQPLGNALVAGWLTRHERIDLRSARADLQRYARPMLRMGMASYGGGLVLVATQFLARAVVKDQLDPFHLGLFQAVWSIGGLYIAFLVNTFKVDYYPTLSEFDDRPEEQKRLLLMQLKQMVRFVVPIVVGMIVAAPLVVKLMYTNEFMPMVQTLRWQLSGDIFRTMGLGMTYLLLAKNQSKSYSGVELLWGLAYFAGLRIGSTTFGIEATGWAYVLANGLYFGVLLALSARLLPPFPVRSVAFAGTGLTIGVVAVAALAGHGHAGFATVLGLALTAILWKDLLGTGRPKTSLRLGKTFRVK